MNRYLESGHSNSYRKVKNTARILAELDKKKKAIDLSMRIYIQLEYTHLELYLQKFKVSKIKNFTVNFKTIKILIKSYQK